MRWDDIDDSSAVDSTLPMLGLSPTGNVPLWAWYTGIHQVAGLGLLQSIVVQGVQLSIFARAAFIFLGHESIISLLGFFASL
jgi:hypothetical protein